MRLRTRECFDRQVDVARSKRTAQHDEPLVAHDWSAPCDLIQNPLARRFFVHHCVRRIDEHQVNRLRRTHQAGLGQRVRKHRLGSITALQRVNVTLEHAKDSRVPLDHEHRRCPPADRQGFDVGTQYRSAVFIHDSKQATLARVSRGELAESGKFRDPIVTEILPANQFYRAEDYHQGYIAKRQGRHR